MCTSSPENLEYPGLLEKKCDQQCERGDSDILLCFSATLHSTLELPAQKGFGPVGAGSEEAKRVTGGLEPLLWRQAGRTGVILSTEEEDLGRQ